MALKNPTGGPRNASFVFLTPELAGATIRPFSERQPSRLGIAAIPKLHGLDAYAGRRDSTQVGHRLAWEVISGADAQLRQCRQRRAQFGRLRDRNLIPKGDTTLSKRVCLIVEQSLALKKGFEPTTERFFLGHFIHALLRLRDRTGKAGVVIEDLC
jgi:hypothetical protein